LAEAVAALGSQQRAAQEILQAEAVEHLGGHRGLLFSEEAQEEMAVVAVQQWEAQSLLKTAGL
jgi:hypothetical protein